MVLVGVDGLDPDRVTEWADDLPTLSRYAEATGSCGLQSVFPPDSVPAWCSIFTGLSPAGHGIVGYMDYMMDNPLDSTSGGYADVLKDNTMWDFLSAEGCKVDIINPFLAYPAWPVNGSMLSGPVALQAAVTMTPDAAYALGEDAPVIGGVPDTPTGEASLPGFIERTRRDIVALTDLACERIAESGADFCFVTYLQLDRVQHFLWRFSDRNDGTYPGPTAFEGEVQRFYALIDSCVERIERTAAGADVMVISDHGHGRRCERVLNVNEVLRRAGLFSSAVTGPRILNARYLLQAAKNTVLEIAYKLQLEETAYSLAKRLPGRKSLKTSAFMKGSSSLAELSNMSGTNPFGGVRVSEQLARERGMDPSAVVAEVIEALEGVRLPDGSRPVLWAKRREDLYAGPNLGAFPDVLFELQPDIGVGWSVEAPLLVTNTMHRRISGGHKRTGFLGMNTPRFISGATPSVEDVTPSVLTLLDVEVPAHLEGTSFVTKETPWKG